LERPALRARIEVNVPLARFSLSLGERVRVRDRLVSLRLSEETDGVTQPPPVKVN
jgi:hypothetical protein